MEKLIRGIHHVALKVNDEQKYQEVKYFYNKVLGLEIKREWREGMMFDSGSGLIEVFNNGSEYLPQGNIRHFAFNVSDVDKLVSKIREAGYEIFVEPKDIIIPSSLPYPARIAFCYGPIGEQIELFQEK